MSILDYTTGLFREPANLRAFVDDPHQALRDAGLPDAMPEEVHDMMSLVAESMPPDHPLQAVVHSDDLVSALQALDVDELIADLHDHHREVEQIEKAVGGPDDIGSHPRFVQCGPDADDEDAVVEPAAADKWVGAPEGDKAVGEALDDPMTPEIEGPPPPADEYPEADDDQVARELDEADFSSAVWGKAIE